MDPKWVQSIFVVSLYELDQITKMKIERARVRLHFPMLGINKGIWSRGWSHDHTRRPIISQNAFSLQFSTKRSVSCTWWEYQMWSACNGLTLTLTLRTSGMPFPSPHDAGGNWKRSFLSTVRPTVHTNSSRKRSFSKTLFKLEEFENADFAF